MPVVSRFDGIVIRMYLRKKEHNPPHIHVVYGEYIGLFSISDAVMYEGDLPLKVQKEVSRFIRHYRMKLMNMWETQNFEMLAPLN